MATVNEKMTAIADAIRDKTGETDTLTLDGMAENVEKVYWAGYNLGYTEGEAQGSWDGYVAGQEKEYDRFWNAYQNNGDRVHYAGAFYGYGWTKESFKPKHDMNVQDGIMMFRHFCATENEPIDLVSVLNECGVTLDFTKAYSMDYTFQSAKISRIGEVNLTRNPTLSYAFSSTFINTIEKITGVNETQVWGSSFSGCSGLTNIRFEGVIGKGINFGSSLLLTHESLMSIIDVLKDFTGTTTTMVLTLHADAKARLSESELAIATQKGWTIA